MRRALLALLLAPLLHGCPPPDTEARAGFVGGRLAFVGPTADDRDRQGCWREAVVVDATMRPAWRFTAPGTGACRRLLPLFYGAAPDGAETVAGPERLEPGRLYLLLGDATGDVRGAFALSRSGTNVVVHNVDPYAPAALELHRRWYETAYPRR